MKALHHYTCVPNRKFFNHISIQTLLESENCARKLITHSLVHIRSLFCRRVTSLYGELPSVSTKKCVIASSSSYYDPLSEGFPFDVIVSSNFMWASTQSSVSYNTVRITERTLCRSACSNLLIVLKLASKLIPAESSCSHCSKLSLQMNKCLLVF